MAKEVKMAEKDLISAGEVFEFIEKKNASEKFDKNNPLYWNLLSEIILESQLIRTSKGITQKDLADIMDTKQTAISRFENMGRAPNYDFIVRLAHALDCNPKLFIDGKYAVKVPDSLKQELEYIAEKKDVTIENYLLDSITKTIEADYKEISFKKIENYSDFDDKSDFDSDSALAA